MNLYSLSLTLTGISPQPAEVQLTKVLKTCSAMLGTDAPVKCFFIPLRHDHRQSSMHAYLICFAYHDFQTNFISESNIWSYPHCKYYVLYGNYTVVITKLVLCHVYIL